MAAQSVLFIGGTGIISSACTALAVERGMEVFLLNRGATTARGPLPTSAVSLTGDANDIDSLRAAVGDREFDVVADFRAFTPRDVQSRLEVLGGRMGQYVFISSASAYQTPPGRLPVIESTPLRNPYWQYSRDKIACEDLLTTAYRERRAAGDHRAAVAHLRQDPAALRRRLDGRRPDAARGRGRGTR